jgi:inosine-uridine nucleoside N-ribohydrolase
VHDLLTVAYLIDPTLFTGHESALEVELNDDLHRGRLTKTSAHSIKVWVADTVNVRFGRKHNLDLTRDQTDKLWKSFFDALSRAEASNMNNFSI